MYVSESVVVLFPLSSAWRLRDDRQRLLVPYCGGDISTTLPADMTSILDGRLFSRRFLRGFVTAFLVCVAGVDDVSTELTAGISVGSLWIPDQHGSRHRRLDIRSWSGGRSQRRDETGHSETRPVGHHKTCK